MILGLGTDMVHIDRIEKLMDRFAERFEKHSYTAQEVQGGKRFADYNKRGRASYYARRFAAKEAFAKALGTGFRNGLIMKDIGVTNNLAGKPSFILTGRAKEMLAELAKGDEVEVHLTLSDDYPLAQATVIIATAY